MVCVAGHKKGKCSVCGGCVKCPGPGDASCPPDAHIVRMKRGRPSKLKIHPQRPGKRGRPSKLEIHPQRPGDPPAVRSSKRQRTSVQSYLDDPIDESEDVARTELEIISSAASSVRDCGDDMTRSCADIAVRTDCPVSRRAMLRLLASCRSNEEMDQMIVDGENRARADKLFMSALRSMQSSVLTVWQSRLLSFPKVKGVEAEALVDSTTCGN